MPAEGALLRSKFLFTFIFVITIAIILSGCSNSNNSTSAKTLTLVAYDSFPDKDTSLNEALKDFEKETGIKVKIANAGDSGAMLSKAILTAGNPEGDVIWGIDNASIAHAIENKIFEPYKTKNLESIDNALTNIVSEDMATPVDYGDVCINYDIKYFKTNEIAIPEKLSDLTKPEYKGLLAVQNPGSSSPGLAFLLASVAEFGDDYQTFWKDLKTNEVKVSDNWNDAYYGLFSGSSGQGQYPLVVSYATSPVAEVIFSEPPVEISPTGNIDATCFRQIEFAGILRGTKKSDDAKKLIDFLVSEKFQKEIPLNLFVNPALENIKLDSAFTQNSRKIENPYQIDPEIIEQNRKEWIDTWTQIVLR